MDERHPGSAAMECPIGRQGCLSRRTILLLAVCTKRKHRLLLSKGKRSNRVQFKFYDLITKQMGSIFVRGSASTEAALWPFL